MACCHRSLTEASEADRRAAEERAKRDRLAAAARAHDKALRRSRMSVESELVRIGCGAYTDAVRSLGVSETSSFATLTVPPRFLVLSNRPISWSPISLNIEC